MDDDYTRVDHEFRKDDVYALTKYRITLDWLGRGAGEVLYHVGCGAGVFNQMAVDFGYEVEAFEPDPQAHALAVASAPSGRCRVHLGGLEGVPGERLADVVVMHDVLEHIEAETAAVEHLLRIMKPSGKLILSVPAMPSLFGYHDEQLGHFRRYTKRSLRAALERHFVVEQVRSFGFTFIPVALVFSRLLRRPYPTGSGEKQGGLLSSAVHAACRGERRLALPIGTSLLCAARPR